MSNTLAPMTGSGPMKCWTTSPANMRTRRRRKKIMPGSSLRSDDDKDVLDIRQIHGRNDRRVAIKFAHFKLIDRSDGHVAGKDTADARGIDVHAFLQVCLLRQEAQANHGLPLAGR